jgi:hypothetical protein
MGLHLSAAGLYSKPQFFDYEHARKEFEITCFSAIKDLLNKTGVQPWQAGSVCATGGSALSFLS